MVSGKWGFCSSKCSAEQDSNCYVDEGMTLHTSKKCIFPFVYNGLTYKQCTYVKGHLKCPIKVDAHGVAKESDMKHCGSSKSCYNSTTINGNPITIGYKDVGSYTNSGSKDLTVSFSFETGVEDSSEHSWSVEASVSAGFDAFGAEMSASLTVGASGTYASSTSQHQSHSLEYKVPPKTRVVLSQQVFKSGVFESRSFKLILSEFKIDAKGRNAKPTVKELNWDDVKSESAK